MAGADLRGSADEQVAMRSLENDKYIRAREQATKVLKDNPGSFIAHWVLARVFHVEEGNLPRALFLLRQARDMFEQEWGTRPSSAAAESWHRKLLMEETWIVGEMDRPLERIALIDAYNEIYTPKREDLKMWPLMKLRRFDEARALGRTLIRSDSFNERVRGWNGLLATEAEALDRKATYKAGIDAVNGTQRRSCVILSNASESALAVYKFDAAESLGKEALKATEDCSNTPYARLAMVYLVTGEFQSTVSAIKEVRKAPILTRYRQQFDMSNKALLADLLFSLGKFEEAERLARQMYRTPDRGGMTSASSTDVKLAYAMTYSQVLTARLHQLQERVSARGWVDSFDHNAEALKLWIERWKVNRDVARLGSESEALATALRPFLRPLLPFAHPAMADAVGRGVVEKAVRAARKAELESEASQGYLDSVEGWLAFQDGDAERATRLGLSALKRLPRRANLVRWRLQGWLAVALAGLDRNDEAKAAWTVVLNKQPSVLRQLGLRLPVVIEADDSDLAQDVAELLEDSPRLQVVDTGAAADLGFVVNVTERDGRGRVCLSDRQGYRFGCAEAKDEPMTADGEANVVGAGPQGGMSGASDVDAEPLPPEVLLADAFHDGIFSPKIELTQSDINSLDGSPMRVGADKVLQDVLGREDER